jgi:hypothetical protein
MLPAWEVGNSTLGIQNTKHAMQRRVVLSRQAMQGQVTFQRAATGMFSKDNLLSRI